MSAYKVPLKWICRLKSSLALRNESVPSPSIETSFCCRCSSPVQPSLGAASSYKIEKKKSITSQQFKLNLPIFTLGWSVEREIDRCWIVWSRDRCWHLDSKGTGTSAIFLFKQGSDVECVTFDPVSFVKALQFGSLAGLTSDLHWSILSFMLQFTDNENSKKQSN